MDAREPRLRRRGFFLHSPDGEPDTGEHENPEGLAVRVRVHDNSVHRKTLGSSSRVPNGCMKTRTPSSSHLIRIDASPLFFPITTFRGVSRITWDMGPLLPHPQDSIKLFPRKPIALTDRSCQPIQVRRSVIDAIAYGSSRL